MSLHSTVDEMFYLPAIRDVRLNRSICPKGEFLGKLLELVDTSCAENKFCAEPGQMPSCGSPRPLLAPVMTTTLPLIFSVIFSCPFL
jgi:hypothetical protein